MDVEKHLDQLSQRVSNELRSETIIRQLLEVPIILTISDEEMSTIPRKMAGSNNSEIISVRSRSEIFYIYSHTLLSLATLEHVLLLTPFLIEGMRISK